MKTSYLLFLFFLFSGISLSFSQEIRGRVMDTDQNPIESAQIVLLRHDSIIDSDYTDKKGQFQLNYKDYPDFDILTYFLGYKTDKQTIMNAFGNIKIQNM